MAADIRAGGASTPPFDASAALGLATTLPLARVGLIIPSSNRMSEPQFQRFAPPGLAIHTTRLRMTGPWKRPQAALHADIIAAAGALADSRVDLIVFHCTGTSMEEGPEADQAITAMIARETGTPSISTGQAVIEALLALRINRLVLISPYVQATNDHERAYLSDLDFEVLHDVALGLSGGNQYITVPPERWVAITREAAREAADGYFLSCTNTTQIGAIAPLEAALGKPVVNSNQATLWACCWRLSGKLGAMPSHPALGRLFTLGRTAG